MKRRYLYLSVCASGASVLAIEALGARVIGPSYGVDLFLSSALIAVTLVALSAGYALGGRWADRNPSLTRFASLLIAAGIWLMLVPAFGGPVMAAARPLGHRPAILAASTALFFPPLAILGMVSPFALKLRAQSVEEVGRSAGDLLAIWMIAGVVSAVLMGFVLVPNFGVSRIMAAIGVMLVLTGIAALRSAARP
jgi:hypothetical protein